MAGRDREIAEDSKPNLHACVSSPFNSLDSQILDSSYSLSFPSEPADIRNWFSSYVDESPALDTGDDFIKGIVSRENEIEKEGFAVEKIQNEKEENFEKFRNNRYRDISPVGEIQSLIKIPDSSYALSFPSEPTDIRNWFSSYIYESPASDTGDDFFNGSISRESETEKEGFAAEKIKKEKVDNLREFRNTKYGEISLVGEIPSLIKDNHGVEGSENHPALINLFSKTIDEEKSLEDKLVQNHDNSSINDDGNSSLNSGDSPQKLEGKFSKEADLILVEIDESLALKHGKSPKELFDMTDSKKVSSEIKVPTKENDFRCPKNNANGKGSTEVHRKNSILWSVDKENETKDFAENGFISMRKKRNTSGNDQNSPKRRSQEVQVEHLKNVDIVSAVRVEDAGVGRKALSERTNFQYQAVQEIPGKWCCPQKSKPNLGPPLKQLRLEQWVHRE